MPIDQLLTHCLDQRNRSPCLIFVHEEIHALQRMMAELMPTVGEMFLAIGPVLSEALLTVSPKQYSNKVPDLLVDTLRKQPPGSVLCTEIDLLFEPSLALDPLHLLRTCSRQRPLIILWPGSFRERVLTYAQPDHAHYRTWRQPELPDGCIQVIA